MTAPIGHADFYPNGGIKQPGCGNVGHGSCSHDAAPNIWVDSIINIGCLHPACTESDFNNNNCPACNNDVSDECNYMGHSWNCALLLNKIILWNHMTNPRQEGSSLELEYFGNSNRR